ALLPTVEQFNRFDGSDLPGPERTKWRRLLVLRPTNPSDLKLLRQSTRDCSKRRVLIIQMLTGRDAYYCVERCGAILLKDAGPSRSLLLASLARRQAFARCH